MKTLHAHDLEMEKKFDEQTRYVFFEKDPTYGEENRRNKVLIKSFITNQNKQLYIKIAEGELKRWNEELEQISTGIGAVPETNEYANGWNECRKQAYQNKKHFIQEQILYWNNILQELNK